MYNGIFNKLGKKTLGLLLAVVATGAIGSAGVAFAHGPGGEHGKWAQMSEAERLEAMADRLDHRVERMAKELELTADQSAKVRQILEAAQTQRMDIRERAQGDREAARGELKALREQTREQLAGVLTQDQLTQLEAKRAERKQRRGKHRHGKRVGKKHLERMAAELDLTDAQVAQIKQIHQNSRAQARQLIEDAGGDHEAARPELRELREQTKQEVAQVLTDEQRQEFKQLRAERKQRVGKKRLARLAAELELTDAQVAQIEQIHKESHAQAKQIIDLAGDREAARPELKALRQETKEKVAQVLTEEQRQELEQLRDERKQRRHGRRGR